MQDTLPDNIALEERLRTPYITFWMDDEQIMHCKYADNLHLSLDVAKSVVESRVYFSKGRSYPLLVDMTGVKSTTRDARAYLASVGATLAKADAVITGSPVNKAIGNVFLAIDKPPVPTKLFTNEEKAHDWLMKYR